MNTGENVRANSPRKRVMTPLQALRWIANNDGEELTGDIVEAAMRGLIKLRKKRRSRT